MSIWGSGTPRREFLFVDDLADALVHLLKISDPPDWINVGSGVDLSILELAQMVARTVGFTGRIELDQSKPDGTPRKLTDITLLRSTDGCLAYRWKTAWQKHTQLFWLKPNRKRDESYEISINYRHHRSRRILPGGTVAG